MVSSLCLPTLTQVNAIFSMRTSPYPSLEVTASTHTQFVVLSSDLPTITRTITNHHCGTLHISVDASTSSLDCALCRRRSVPIHAYIPSAQHYAEGLFGILQIFAELWKKTKRRGFPALHGMKSVSGDLFRISSEIMSFNGDSEKVSWKRRSWKKPRWRHR